MVLQVANSTVTEPPETVMETAVDDSGVAFVQQASSTLNFDGYYDNIVALNNRIRHFLCMTLRSDVGALVFYLQDVGLGYGSTATSFTSFTSKFLY